MIHSTDSLGSSKKHQNNEPLETVKIPRLSLLLGLLVLIALIVFVYFHVGDAHRFLSLLTQADPKWLILVILLQVSTYLSVGMIWFQIIRVAQYKVSMGALARLSVEKLSIDQLIPALGLSGNLMVYRAMKRLQLPRWLALEAILTNILAHYIAFALVTFSTLMMLWYWHDITPLILTVAGIFTIILIAVPLVIILLIAYKDKKLPPWLFRIKLFKKINTVIKSVSAKQIYSPKLLAYASLFNLLIFLLDGGSLWAVLRSLNIEASFITAFMAIVLASIAATLSALPGGIGGFEAGAVAILTLLGVPLEAALTGTLIFRGFSLWLPLLPGLYFARKDVMIKL
jgi:glycosyltransferase 2 family protein